jgi:hypothetical protein
VCTCVQCVCTCVTCAGQYCQLDVDECSLQTSPCLNGATCSNYRGGYLCICVSGWQGKNCEINIDDCARRPCYNGGTCHDRVGYFYCECPPSPRLVHECSIQYSNYLPVRISSVVSCSEYSYCDVSELMCQMR